MSLIYARIIPINTRDRFETAGMGKLKKARWERRDDGFGIFEIEEPKNR